VRIVLGIGIAMVVPMMGGPPQRPALHAGRADQREHQLHGTRGAEGTVREIAVVERGDREHAHRVEQGSHRHGDGRHADPDHAQAAQMQQHEGQHPQPVHPVRIGVVRRRYGGAVEPLAQAA
jgi:hypothetical protein